MKALTVCVCGGSDNLTMWSTDRTDEEETKQ